jgi:16S rRNA (uracil1498-N3)-methyltransferase
LDRIKGWASITAAYNRGVIPRFFAPGARPGELTELPGDEAQHLTRVLRLAAGAAVIVFDGLGHEFEGVVVRTGKGGASVQLGAAREPSAREAGVAVTLAQAVVKGDKMDDIVRDAVMMGVAAIQPVVSARSEIALAALERGRRQARWQRVAVASAKQCGRAVVPPVLAPCALERVTVALAERMLPGPGLMFVEPSAAAEVVSLSDLDGQRPRETTVLVGPEGGWERSEIEQAAATCRLVTLGSRTLRADAVPVVAMAALFAIWKEF